MSQEPYPYQQPPYAYQAPPSRPTNGLAVASLVLSILGLIGILPLIGSIIGLIFGYMAKGQIAQSGGMQGGEGMAKAGIIIGWVTVGLYLLGGCMALLFGVILPALGFGGLTACGICGSLGNIQY